MLINFQSQLSTIQDLVKLSGHDHHSVLLEGPAGCGKTYLSRYYSNLTGCQDFVCLEPVTKDIRTCISSSYELSNKITVCIENLDSGQLSSSYALLKFLEEPSSNVYIVVTCRNISYVPDTIVSRSSVVTCSMPTSDDIDIYSKNLNYDKYMRYSKLDIWRIVRTFSDVDNIFSLTLDQINYLDKLRDLDSSKSTISTVVWNLGHYPDNTETDVDLVIRYLLCNTRNSYRIKVCNDCLNDLFSKKISKVAILSKFALEYKYGR